MIFLTDWGGIPVRCKEETDMNEKHGLLLFAASCIPACGEMYQGYMKRGVSILTVCSGIFILAVLLNIGALSILLLPVWLFSFFDSYNLRTQLRMGTQEPDAFLFGLGHTDREALGLLLQKRRSLVGWGLVGLGIWILYSTVAEWISDLFGQFFDNWWLRHVLSYDVPRLVVTVGILALGIWFIRGPSKAKTEDIPDFVPPQSSAGCEPDAAPASEESPVSGQEAPHGDN